MSCLMINDIDAGLGRYGNTQVTVNNQIVVGTLMNLCDNPTRVSVGQQWREGDITHRIPIIVTGNDFSTMYAPLIRDGRMEKFYCGLKNLEVLKILAEDFFDKERRENSRFLFLQSKLLKPYLNRDALLPKNKS
ncbi:Ribulose bisphosphate carboxylase/oxygenase activase, chloroplastic [Capsicum chinense]|nr:Ribulose bisphosphate carboxylase/oxygenase activase, chloroplastic [Capsicum chinense]